MFFFTYHFHLSLLSLSFLWCYIFYCFHNLEKRKCKNGNNCWLLKRTWEYCCVSVFWLVFLSFSCNTWMQLSFWDCLRLWIIKIITFFVSDYCPFGIMYTIKCFLHWFRRDLKAATLQKIHNPRLGIKQIFFAMISAFITCLNHQRKHFIFFFTSFFQIFFKIDRKAYVQATNFC